MQDPRTPEERERAREEARKRLAPTPYKSEPVTDPFPHAYPAPGEDKTGKPDKGN